MYAKKPLLAVLDFNRIIKAVKYRKILERTQWLERKELIHFQQRRLLGLLKFAYENVPYYHKLFKGKNLRPNDIKTVEDLKKLPILKKEDIRKTPQEFISSLSHTWMIPCLTSGTTSRPLKFYRTKEDFSWCLASRLRAYGWGQYEFGDKIGLIWALKPSELKSPYSRIKKFIGNKTILLNAYGLSEKSIRSSAKRIEKLRPHYISGYSSCIYMLAKYIISEGMPSAKLKGIFTTAETLLPSQRRLIENVFECNVYDQYGSHEISSIASECAKNVGYHIHSENVAVEIVKDGECAASGETGAILVTSLHNFAMPFIRYYIGDTAIQTDESCPCGRGLPLIKSLEGRTYEYFKTSDGSLVGLKDLDIFFEDLPVDMFQIFQRNPDEILIKIVKKENYSEKDTEFIINNIAWDRGKAKIYVEIVDVISPTKSGKKQYFISKIPIYNWAK